MLYNTNVCSSIEGAQEYFTQEEMFSLFLDLKHKDNAKKIAPSCYLKELMMSTEDRCSKLCARHQQCISHADFKKCVFLCTPEICIFQNYVPQKTYCITLKILNCSKVTQNLHLERDESPVFTVQYRSSSVTRVAPGITVQIDVIFKPYALQDYKFEIRFKTSDYPLVIPTYAIGPRPMVDIPDEINFGSCPVKILTKKTLVVRNIGMISTGFTFITDPPFSIEPCKGILNTKDTIHVTVGVSPLKSGDLQSHLILQFEKGEQLFIKLQVLAENLDVYISETLIKFRDTFLGLSSHHTFTLFNRSHYPLDFQWCKFAKSEEDEEESRRLKETFKAIKEQEKKKVAKMEFTKLIDKKLHDVTLERMYQDEVNELQCSPFHFQDESYSLIPATGCIWPHSSVDITAFFSPKEENLTVTTAFCEIKGQEERLLVILVGNGLPPTISLNMTSLNVSDIFLCSTNSYEIIATNKGDIPGEISYEPNQFLSGFTVECNPHSLNLEPNEQKVFLISLTSGRPGEFFEKLTFRIMRSDKEITFTISGNVVVPSLYFDLKSLDFGDVPIGFKTEKRALLSNSSLVPVNFSLRTPFDSNKHSLSYKQFLKLSSKTLPHSPKEIFIQPAEGTVTARSSCPINVVLCPNVSQTMKTYIKVDLWDSASSNISLPVTYNAKFPKVSCVPDDVVIKFCFINYVYKRYITLKNNSHIPGFFYILPQEIASEAKILYSISRSQDVIRPNSEVIIPVDIMTTALGTQEEFIRLLIMGQKDPSVICKIVCNGQGPVVSTPSYELNWGKIPVLHPVSLTLPLTNESPIPASYEISLENANSPWEIRPVKGTMKPQETLTVTATVLLVDTKVYSDMLQVHVSDSHTLDVNLHAEGFGCSITIEPVVIPTLDLGAFFSSDCVRKELRVINNGTKHHLLLWSSSGNPASKESITDKNARGVFSLSPKRMDLAANESDTLILEVKSDKPQTIKETFYCYATVNNIGRKQQILSFDVVAMFIVPELEFSKQRISFHLDMEPGKNKMMKLKDWIGVTNASVLPVKVWFSVGKCFKIIDPVNGMESEEVEICIKELSSIKLLLCFDPNIIEKKTATVFNDFLTADLRYHREKFFIPLTAEINFPSVRLVPDVIDFGCIPLGTDVCEQLTLVNTSPLPVKYSLHWVKDSVDIVLSKTENLEPVEKLVCSTNGDTSSGFLPDTLIETAEARNDVNPGDEFTPVESRTIKTNCGDEMEKVFPSPAETSKGVNKTQSCEVTQEELKKELYPLVTNYVLKEYDISALKLLPRKSQDVDVISKVFALTPLFGILDPHTSIKVSVNFQGISHLTAKAKLECTVEGGSSENVEISGEVASLIYEVDRKIINFGRQLFCEKHIELILLENKGSLPFKFLVNVASTANYLIEKLSVHPSSGTVCSNSKIELNVVIFPGVPGNFRDKFQLEIGYLSPIDIIIKGEGALPQITVDLPRPSYLKLPAEKTYAVVSAMIESWAPVISENSDPQMTFTSGDTLVDAGSLVTDTEDWTIFPDAAQLYPSSEDIDLAIEEALVCEMIMNEPEILSLHSVEKTIQGLPQIWVPSYEINMGFVCVNSKVDHSFNFRNCGPFPVSLRLKKTQKNSYYSNIGLTVNFRNSTEVNVGYFVPMFLLFLPPKFMFKEKKTSVKTVLYIEVSHGAVIPIDVHATVVVPHLTVSTDCINFGIVKFGECAVKGIRLINDGFICCEIEASIKWKPKDHNPQFGIRTTEFLLQPDQSTVLDIYFQPYKTGQDTAELVLTVKDNENPIKVVLEGAGTEPRLLISNSTIKFSPQLPFASCEPKNFTVENPCDYSVEFFFSDYDSQVNEEERILEAITHYFNTDEFLLPERSPGEKLHVKLYEFYQSLVKEVGEKLQKQVDQADVDALLRMEAFGRPEDKKVRRRTSSRIRSSSSRRTSSSIVSSIKKYDPLDYKTPEEIHTLVLEHINELRTSGVIAASQGDPVKAVINTIFPQSLHQDPAFNEPCMLLIFYGAPYTDYVYAAHQTSRALSLTCVSLDELIVESLMGDRPVAQKVIQLINQAYKDMAIEEDNKQDIEDEKIQDPLEEVMHKVTMMNSSLKWKTKNPSFEYFTKPYNKPETVYLHQDEKSSTTQVVPSASVADTNKGSTTKKMFSKEEMSPYYGTAANVPMDLLIQLLKQRLESEDFHNGVVVNTLKSVFFPHVSIALAALLRAVGNIRYIHCVLMTNSLESYMEWTAKEKETEMGKKRADYDAKVELIKSLDLEDIDLLDDECKRLHSEMVLRERKERHRMRKLDKMEKEQEKLQTPIAKKTKVKKQKKSVVTGESSKKHRASTRVSVVGTLLDNEKRTSFDEEGRKLSTQRQLRRSIDDFDSRKIRKTTKSLKVSNGEQISQLNEKIPSDIQLEFELFENVCSSIVSFLESWDKGNGVLASANVEKQQTSKKLVRRKRVSDSGQKISAESVGITTLDAPQNSVASEETKKPDLGIPVWIIDCRNPDKKQLEFSLNMLKNIAEDTYQFCKTDIGDAPSLDGIIYSHVRRHVSRNKPAVHSVFAVNDMEPPDEINSEESKQVPEELLLLERQSIVSVKENKPKKRTSKIRERVSQGSIITSSLVSKKDKISSPSIKEEAKLKSRWLLMPGDKKQFQVKFEPTAVGTHRENFLVGITGLNFHLTLTATGICDIPTLDMNPQSVFPKVLTKTPELKTYHCVYLKDSDMFDFGSIIAGRQKDKSIAHQRAAEFKFTNISTTPADIFFSFLDKIAGKVDDFVFAPEKLDLKPGETKPLLVSAHPSAIGQICEILVCSIKNNPKVETIKICCVGIKVEFEVENKAVSFEQVRLHHKETRDFILWNKATVPVVWKILDFEDLGEEFSLSSHQGLIKPLGKCNVTVAYFPKELRVINKMPVRLEVYNELGSGEPVFTDVILISAEAVDVMVDIQFAHSEHNNVYFGDVLAGQKHQQEITLTNKGKAWIDYKFVPSKIQDNKSQYYRKIITINPLEGKLNFGKQVVIQLCISPETEINIEGMVLFNCNIYHNETVLVTVLPISLTVSSSFLKYNILPDHSLNFGPLVVGSKSNLAITIENIGKFEFKYSVNSNLSKSTSKSQTIESRRGLDVSVKQSIERGDSSKYSIGRKTVKRFDPNALTVGNFVISNPSGTVSPGEISEIPVNCHIESVGIFEEDISINIFEKNSDVTENMNLQLLAEGCLPALDHSNIDKIFQEQYVCQSLDEFEDPLSGEYYCIFLNNEKVLLFRNVCLGTTATARLRFYNPGKVPCDISLSIDPKGARETGAYFVVSPERVTISPFEEEIITISFSPQAIEKYSSAVEVLLEMPHPIKSQKFIYKLEGEVDIPHVTVISAQELDSDGNTCVTFHPIMLGNMDKRNFTLKNTGTLRCKVILEICKNVNGVFTLYPAAETKNLLKLSEDNEPVKNTAVLTLDSNQLATFDIQFKPEETGLFEAEIQIFIVNNPYEVISFLLYGDCYREDVTLDGLVPESPQTKNSHRQSIITSDSLSYHVDFGPCCIKKMQKKKVQLKNNSDTFTYRFEWDDSVNIIISPSVGHLMPKSEKDTVITLLTSDPMSLTKVELQCRVQKIELNSNAFGDVGWDDRQMKVFWSSEDKAPPVNEEADTLSREEIESSSSVLKISEESSTEQLFSPDYSLHLRNLEFQGEPVYTEIPGSDRILRLFVSAVTDYATCSVSDEEINFKDTFILQSCYHNVTLSNTGPIPFEYKWIVSIDESMLLPLPESPESAELERSLNSNMKTESKTSKSVNIEFDKNADTKDNRAMPLTGKESFINTKEQNSNASGKIHQIPCESSTGSTEWFEENYIPFSIKPEKGILNVAEDVQCKITFAPLDVLEYKGLISCSVACLHPNQKQIEIPVKGCSLLPFCHFDIEDSDYLLSGRRDSLLPNPAIQMPGVGSCISPSPDTKVIEFSALGIGATVNKKFNLTNPTSVSYVFSWRCESVVVGDTARVFQCMTPDGWVDRGKQAEIVFSYSPQKLCVYESFWKFTIPEHNVEIPFLLVGFVREPDVYFLSAHISLPSTLVGNVTSSTATLVNGENMPLPYSFDHDQRVKSLSVEPSKGILKRKSENKIIVSFKPDIPGEKLFHCQCNVDRLAHPLKLTVYTAVYKVQCLVQYCDVHGKRQDTSPTCENIIDFETIYPKVTKVISFTVTNIGKVSFYYHFKYDDELMNKRSLKLGFCNDDGHVTPQSRATVTMSFSLLKKATLHKFPVVLEICQGPQYKFFLSAISTVPQFEFSFVNYNFGPCFIQKSDICYYEKNLVFSNKDESPMLLECHFDKKPHLKVLLSSEHVPPNSSITIPFMFFPYERVKYKEVLNFIVNGIHEQKVAVGGEGIDLKVDLVHPQHISINMGMLQVGDKVTKVVPVINKSFAPVTVQFLLATDDSTLKETLHIFPTTPCTINSNKIEKIKISYRPMKRMKQFNEKVLMKSHDTVEPICVVKGSCMGAEFSLDRDTLQFGSVTVNCSRSLKVLLANSGDIGSKFEWCYNDNDSSSGYSSDYSVVPVNGYVPPGSSLAFTVTFHPVQEKKNARCILNCKMESYCVLTLTVMGTSVPLGNPRESINFTACVRDKDVNTITVKNSTGQLWYLYPKITGDFFSGSETLLVNPYSSNSYEVTYAPLSMSKENKHAGSVLFQLPDGQGLLYSLEGTSNPPQPMKKINLEVPCKTECEEILLVKNWLCKPQRFKVTTEIIKSEKYDPVFSVMCNEYVDVPGNAEHQFRLAYHAYRESSVMFKVIFTNEETQEYQFCELSIKFTKCGPLQTINMHTCARQMVSYELKLKNPLQFPISYNLHCSVADLDFPSTCFVPANSEKSIQLAYLPLIPGEHEKNFEASCSELGLFPYLLKLSAIPAPPEKTVVFNTRLGSSTTVSVQIQNLFRSKSDFICKVDHGDFSVDKHITVSAGLSVMVAVKHEPSSLTSTKATLTVSSASAGEYVFPLTGSCMLPKPQGPLIIKPGSGTTIMFKNVFNETKTFNIFVNVPQFVVKNSMEIVKPKKDCKILVSLQTPKLKTVTEPQFPIIGKLEIKCDDVSFQGISWVYYLKGVLE